MQLAEEISASAREAIESTWLHNAARPPPKWAMRLAVPSVVEGILLLARDVLFGLDVPVHRLLDVAPEELAYFWRKVYSDHHCHLSSSPHSEPDAEVLATEIAKSIATSIRSMHQQGQRYRDFLKNGSPAGVPEFPEYVAAGGHSSHGTEVQWDRFAHSHSTKRKVAYELHMEKLPRRRQSLRSGTHEISDLEHPGRFT